MKRLEKLQHEEAIQRLDMMIETGLKSEAREVFKNGNVKVFGNPYPWFVTPELIRHIVKVLEAEYGIVIFLGFFNDDPDDLSCSFLYVSPNLEEWEDERELLWRKIPLSLYLRWPQPDIRFGLFSIDPEKV